MQKDQLKERRQLIERRIEKADAILLLSWATVCISWSAVAIDTNRGLVFWLSSLLHESAFPFFWVNQCTVYNEKVPANGRVSQATSKANPEP
jgi:hypothetical protein